MNSRKRKPQKIAESIKRKRGNTNNKSDQQTIEEEDISYGINISAYLRLHNEISYENHYPVSTLAKVYFRDHSNIDEILSRYMEQQKVAHESKEKYLTSVIRRVISYGQVRYTYPFNMFMFESPEHEVKAKFLLKYPGIKTEEDLKETNFYLNEISLKHCQINASKDNKFRQDEQDYLIEKREKFGYQKLSNYTKNAIDHALRKYYEENNLLISIHIDDITIGDLFEISTFKEAVEYKMRSTSIPQNQTDETFALTFQALKDKRWTIFKLERFKVDPHFNLITNDLTEEQEKIVMFDRYEFFKRTNAKYLLQLNKKSFPITDESLDIASKRKERRWNFWRKFVYAKDKKLPPFNHLHWIETSSENGESRQNVQAQSDGAGPSNIHLWKGRIVQEVNDEPERPGHNSANLLRERTVQEENVVENSQNLKNNNNNNNINQVPKKREFKEFLSITLLPPKFREIISILKKQNDIRSIIENEIIDSDEDRNFTSSMWEMNSEPIINNYIYFKLIDQDKQFFFNAMTKCEEPIRSKINDELKNLGIEVANDIGEPLASSTQTMEDEMIEDMVEEVLNQEPIDKTARPFQNFTNLSDDIVIGTKKKFNAPPAPVPSTPTVQIKLEKLTQNPPETEDSDCQVITPFSTEIISVSDDEDANNQVNQSNVGEIQRIDRYRRNLNFESQGDQNSELQQIDYQLLSRRIAYENITTRTGVNRRQVEESDESSSKSAHN